MQHVYVCQLELSVVPFTMLNASFKVSDAVDFTYIIASVWHNPRSIRTAPSRSASQSFLLQLKRFLKCINHSIPSRFDMKVSILSPYFKVYNGMH